MKKCNGEVICSHLGEDCQCKVNSDFCPHLASETKAQICRDNEFYAAFGARLSFEKSKTYRINFTQVKTIKDIKEILQDLELNIITEDKDKIKRFNNSNLWINDEGTEK